MISGSCWLYHGLEFESFPVPSASYDISDDCISCIALLEDRWDSTVADGLDAPELLRYRSNLLGSDLRITNFAGGNTSSKVVETDPLTGKPVEVLWVKGSGGDLGSMKRTGFATLYLEKLLALERIYKRRGIRRRDGGDVCALRLPQQSGGRID